METVLTVNEKSFRVLRLLGHGKGGYSYLVEADGMEYVLKQIHHEPCSYYTFGNKIEAEIHDYGRIRQTGIRIPKLLEVDVSKERILKEYIDGPTVYDMVKNGAMEDRYIEQVREMAALAQTFGLNIDYFPTNFVVRDGALFYIDFECNGYMEQWNFENWGSQYWWKSPEFLNHKQI